MTFVEAVRLPPSPDFHKGACERRITVGHKARRRPNHLNIPFPHGNREPVGLPEVDRAKPKRIAAVLDLEWSKEPVDEWEKENRRLADLAANGDDESLFELVRRDPRQLQSELVLEKVLHWKRQYRIGQIAGNDPANTAKSKLRQLGNAVAATSEGSGNRNYVPARLVAERYDKVLAALDLIKTSIESRRGKPIDTQKLVEAYGGDWITEADITELENRPRALRDIARTITGRGFGVGSDQVKKLIEKHRKAQS